MHFSDFYQNYIQYRFKSIWGGKTEERRFKDGQICVAVHFEESNDPIQDAVKYLFDLHGKVDIDYCGEIISQGFQFDYISYII